MSNTSPAHPRFSATETLARIRKGCKLAEALDGELTSSCRKEVGFRVVHQISSTLAGATVWLDGDDLGDSDDLKGASRRAICQLQGSVLHVYYFERGEYGEGLNTITIWLGTDELEPALLSVPACSRFHAPQGRSGVEPGRLIGEMDFTPIHDSTELTELAVEEVERRTNAEAAYNAAELVRRIERAAAAEARAERYAAGNFQVGDYVHAKFENGCNAEGEIVERGPSQFRLNLRGGGTIHRFSQGQLIEANAERAASSARYARKEVERMSGELEC